ncbi:unnamed protein product [Orchesella dallaii]|uniref:Uncharacterized protein n=1 Tax=Orchesella dallaii TaxID=48710 RepID=A0ABP1PLI4_9HEXA
MSRRTTTIHFHIFDPHFDLNLLATCDFPLARVLITNKTLLEDLSLNISWDVTLTENNLIFTIPSSSKQVPLIFKEMSGWSWWHSRKLLSERSTCLVLMKDKGIIPLSTAQSLKALNINLYLENFIYLDETQLFQSTHWTGIRWNFKENVFVQYVFKNMSDLLRSLNTNGDFEMNGNLNGRQVVGFVQSYSLEAFLRSDDIKDCVNLYTRFYWDCTSEVLTMLQLSISHNFTVDIQVFHGSKMYDTEDFIFSPLEYSMDYNGDTKIFFIENDYNDIWYCHYYDKGFSSSSPLYSLMNSLAPHNWLFLIISCFGSTRILVSFPKENWSQIQITLKKLSKLLLRRFTSRENLLPIFGLISIVVTTIYEAKLTSIATVPPEEKLYRSSEELLQNSYKFVIDGDSQEISKDYGVLVYFPQTKTQQDMEMLRHKIVFIKGINEITSYLLDGGYAMTFSQLKRKIFRNVLIFERKYTTRNYSTSCCHHFEMEEHSPVSAYWQFKLGGGLHERVMKTMRYLQESHLYKMWRMRHEQAAYERIFEVSLVDSNGQEIRMRYSLPILFLLAFFSSVCFIAFVFEKVLKFGVNWVNQTIAIY